MQINYSFERIEEGWAKRVPISVAEQVFVMQTYKIAVKNFHTICVRDGLYTVVAPKPCSLIATFF